MLLGTQDRICITGSTLQTILQVDLCQIVSECLQYLLLAQIISFDVSMKSQTLLMSITSEIEIVVLLWGYWIFPVNVITNIPLKLVCHALKYQMTISMLSYYT